MKKLTYKGFTIEQCYWGFKYYDSEYGPDVSFTNGRWTSNVQHAETIEEAEWNIDVIIEDKTVNTTNDGN